MSAETSPGPSLPDMAGQSDCAASLHRALIDTGAEASTTHLRHLLHKYETVPFEKYMSDAGNNRRRSIGFGYLKIVTNDDNGVPTRLSMVHCWHTPTLPHTVMSPGATVKRHRKRFTSCTAFKNFATGRGHDTLHSILGTSDVILLGILSRGTLFTEPLVHFPAALHDCEPSEARIHYLSKRATRILWHQRLRHIHMRRLADLHTHVDGIHRVKVPPDIEGCDTCWTCKLRKKARGTGDTRKDATVAGQGISLDFGFIVQRSNDLARYEKFLGLNGESAYLLLADHKTDVLFGISTVDKSPPLAWMNRWLAQYRPSELLSRHPAATV
jgi:hypothetical protein